VVEKCLVRATVLTWLQRTGLLIQIAQGSRTST